MTRLFGIAGFQLFVNGAGGNLDYMERRLAQTVDAYPWVRMAVFSELAVCGALHANAEPFPGPSEKRFCRLAKKHRLWILTGSVYEKAAGDKIYNTCSVIDPKGHVVGRYRKVFPFTPFAATTTPGTDFLVFEVPDVGVFGVSICYDMWIPEHSRTLAAMGAEVILHPVMTTTIDRDVELSITRATAAVNQCYVFEVNGSGGGGCGRSTVIGPDGDIVFEAGPTEQLFPVELDLDRVTQSRRRGLLRLGQPLKSFRDAPVHFDVYDRDSPLRARLAALGPVKKPSRDPEEDL